MSKAKESKHNQPNVVAKIMGLEAFFPRGELNLALEKGHRKYYSQHMCGHSGSPFKHWQMMEDSFVDKEMLHEVCSSTKQTAHNKGVHKTWLQSQRTSHVIGDKAPERGGSWGGEDVDVEKIALIHQKFMEAKLMSTDERLRQSKQFKDALEVLSSNSDLLIRLLDSQHLYQLHSMPPLAEMKHINLLKPLTVDNDKSAGKGKGKKKKKNNELVKKQENVDQAAVWGRNKNLGYSPGNQKVDDEALVQSTRIVVLKPSSGKPHELKTLFSPTTSSSPRNPENGNFYPGPEDDDNVLESRKVAKETITQQVHESLYPSVTSNCYSGDESSFSKSYHGYKDGNFTDLEVMSPTHSWDDHINHCGSLYSTQSLGGATCSPESSVCIEAKKRIYERWTMMESNSKCRQKQMQVRRTSGTLGEMLSLSHIKKSLTSEVKGIHEEYQEPSSKSVSCSHSFNEEMSIHGFPKNPPLMSNETGLKVKVCDHDDAGKAHGSKVVTKSKSMRSSFKGKVSSFLFSRKKKSTKEKSSPSQHKDESQCSVTETSVSLIKDDLPQFFNGTGFQECSLPALCESLGNTSSDSVSNRQQQAIIPLEPGLIVSKEEISSENLDQPSPISVLDPPFEDDNHESLDCMKSIHHGSLVPLKSNLIDKSPPIESIARTLSWGDSCADSSSLDTKLLEEQEWLLFVEKLLSAAGLYDQDQIQHESLHTRWHSLESPLDPSLRDKYANLNGKENQHLSEPRRRKMRSNQKLVFDCVNAALLELASGHCGSENEHYNLKGRRVQQSGGHITVPVQKGACPLFADHIIVAQMKELMMASGVVRCAWGDCGDSNSLGVENLVRKEVVGIGWVELMELEINILAREIERELIQELVENAAVDFTGRACNHP